MRILIADDDATNRLVLSAYLKKDGYDPIIAEDGQQAVDLFLKENPDLVLMDVMMPVMDGYDATKLIKEHSGDNFVPVIFLTAMTDENALKMCVDVGGDDFLTKPYNRVILKAKIEALTRVRQLYKTVYKQKQELELNTLHIQQEQEVARKVFDSIMNPGCLSADTINVHLSPMSLFNGDMVLAAVKPTGGMHVLFGDFTGHGLAASLGALPVSEVFYTMTAKGYGLDSILQEINRKLKTQLPIGMFLAAAAVDIDISNSFIRVWNGAIPAMYILKNGELSTLSSDHVPLGILPASAFDNQLTIHEIESDEYLVLSTDGILEAADPETDEMFGSSRFEAILTESNPADIEKDVLAALDAFTNQSEQTDDVTLAVISCDLDKIRELSSQASSSRLSTPSDWQFTLTMYHSAIKQVDPIPLINQLMNELSGSGMQYDKLSTVMSELYCNSLDHGLLNLDSSLKETPEGFMSFYESKESRLKALDEGVITIKLTHEAVNDGGALTIELIDSGAGFDVSRIEEKLLQKNSFSGRGIGLIQHMCESIKYNDKGNQVTCCYTWES